MYDVSTYFVDESEASLGNTPGVLAIPLKEGMKITIHGHPGEFTVVNWSYHHGHPDEKAGLTIVLRKR